MMDNFIFILRNFLFIILRNIFHIPYINIVLFICIPDLIVSCFLILKKKIITDVSFFYTLMMLMTYGVVHELQHYIPMKYILYVDVPVLSFVVFMNDLWIFIVVIFCEHNTMNIIIKSIIESLCLIIILQYT